MPEINDVVLGETITTEWGNAIRDRTIQRYATVADRDSEHPNPALGDLAFIEADASHGVWFWNGTRWQGLGADAGDMQPTARGTAPRGWLFCHGQEISRSTYATLFAAIGTTYGAGNGSTTFNLPDLRQRFPLGKAAAGTGDTLGDTGGAIDHVHTAEHRHTISPPSTPTTQAGSHTHSNPVTGEQIEPATAAVRQVAEPPFIGVSTSGHEHPVGDTDPAGAHTHNVNTSPFFSAFATPTTSPNNPPFLVVNWIIRT